MKRMLRNKTNLLLLTKGFVGIFLAASFLSACGGGDSDVDGPDLRVDCVAGGDCDGDGLVEDCDQNDKDASVVLVTNTCDLDGDGYLDAAPNASGSFDQISCLSILGAGGSIDQITPRVACDNCPGLTSATANPDQADSDGDLIGDACDGAGDCDDRDSDGICDITDLCPDDPINTCSSLDADEDGFSASIDCDDNNPDVNPGSNMFEGKQITNPEGTEVRDATDYNCDGKTAVYVDIYKADEVDGNGSVKDPFYSLDKALQAAVNDDGQAIADIYIYANHSLTDEDEVIAKGKVSQLANLPADLKIIGSFACKERLERAPSPDSCKQDNLTREDMRTAVEQNPEELTAALRNKMTSILVDGSDASTKRDLSVNAGAMLQINNFSGQISGLRLGFRAKSNPAEFRSDAKVVSMTNASPVFDRVLFDINLLGSDGTTVVDRSVNVVRVSAQAVEGQSQIEIARPVFRQSYFHLDEYKNILVVSASNGSDESLASLQMEFSSIHSASTKTVEFVGIVIENYGFASSYLSEGELEFLGQTLSQNRAQIKNSKIIVDAGDQIELAFFEATPADVTHSHFKGPIQAATDGASAQEFIGLQLSAFNDTAADALVFPSQENRSLIFNNLFEIGAGAGMLVDSRLFKRLNAIVIENTSAIVAQNTIALGHFASSGQSYALKASDKFEAASESSEDPLISYLVAYNNVYLSQSSSSGEDKFGAVKVDGVDIVTLLNNFFSTEFPKVFEFGSGSDSDSDSFDSASALNASECSLPFGAAGFNPATCNVEFAAGNIGGTSDAALLDTARDYQITSVASPLVDQGLSFASSSEVVQFLDTVLNTSVFSEINSSFGGSEAVDLNGGSRIVGGQIDIGADEFEPATE